MKKLLLFAATLALGLGGCSKEYLNPSSVSQSQATGSSDGLLTLCNGLQQRYSTGAR